MPLHVSSTRAHHQEVKIALNSLWYHHTYRCDDTRVLTVLLCFDSQSCAHSQSIHRNCYQLQHTWQEYHSLHSSSYPIYSNTIPVASHEV